MTKRDHIKLPAAIDPTHANLDAALLDQKVAGAFRGKDYAYIPVLADNGKWAPGIAVANETGYHPITGLDFDAEIECRDFCRGMNLHINLPPDHEASIIASTMGGFSYRARAIINGVCAYSAFGLLCPEDRADELEKAIAEARAITDAFNESANLSRVYVYVITGRIAPDDVEAVKAINSEVRDLLADMERGVKNVDVKLIREAASRAKSLGSMLSPDASARITVAIEAARGAAKKIVQAGEQAANEIDTRAIRSIVESRTAFLDIGDVTEVKTPTTEGRSLDLAPAATVKPTGAKARNAEVE